jgi:hypothetical protein
MTFKATLHAFPASLQRFVAYLLEWRQISFPLRSLQKHAYHQVKGIVSAQMTCTAIRLVAACYSKRKRKKLSGTVNFKNLSLSFSSANGNGTLPSKETAQSASGRLAGEKGWLSLSLNYFHRLLPQRHLL